MADIIQKTLEQYLDDLSAGKKKGVINFKDADKIRMCKKAIRKYEKDVETIQQIGQTVRRIHLNHDEMQKTCKKIIDIVKARR